MKKINLDQEEKKILDYVESGNWGLIENMDAEIQNLKNAVKENNKKKPINIRISQSDLLKLKEKASVEGIPYQVLINGILHKYVSGTL